ncbi:MAG: MFS transporter [Burkholderiales bacterium]
MTTDLNAGQHGERLPLKLIATVWLPFACGYFLSYGYRTINAIISPDLVHDLGVNPNQLGLLTSAYFLTFALFQAPLGLLLDRYGPRRVEAALLLCAAAGSVLFGLSQSLSGLVLGRALIGLGVSACLMASIKAFVQWFPPSRLATLNGWLLAAGGLGAISASVPVEAALKLTDWRGLFLVIGAMTAAVAAMIFFLVPDRNDGAQKESIAELVAGLRSVFASALFWRVSLLFAFVQGTFLSVQGLWVAPWLRDVAGYPRDEVGHMLLWLALSMTVGFAAVGNLSDWLSRRGVEAMTVLKTGIGVSIAMFALIVAGMTTATAWIWMIYAFCGTGSVLVYSILSKAFPQKLTGRVSTATNLILFAFAFAAQWGLGAVIGEWPAEAGKYPSAAYRAAFAVPLALQCAAYAVVLFGKRR